MEEGTGSREAEKVQVRTQFVYLDQVDEEVNKMIDSNFGEVNVVVMSGLLGNQASLDNELDLFFGPRSDDEGTRPSCAPSTQDQSVPEC